MRKSDAVVKTDTKSKAAMLIVEAPGEVGAPPALAPLHLPMMTLTKLNFTDYSAKVNKQYNESEQRDSRGYDSALAARLSYEQSVCGAAKLNYNENNRLAFDQTFDNINTDPTFLLPSGYCFSFIITVIFTFK